MADTIFLWLFFDLKIKKQESAENDVIMAMRK